MRRSLTELRTAPETLEAEAARLETKEKELTVKHYRIHLEEVEACAHVAKDASEFEREATRASELVEKLSNEASSLVDSGVIEKCSEYGSLAHALEKHQELVEVLGMPALMENCIRDAENLGSRALDLRERASEILGQLKDQDGEVHSVLLGVVQEVIRLGDGPLHRRLLELCSRHLNSVPSLLRVVGILQRLYRIRLRESRPLAEAWNAIDLAIANSASRDAFLEAAATATKEALRPARARTGTKQVLRGALGAVDVWVNVGSAFVPVFVDESLHLSAALAFRRWAMGRVEEWEEAVRLGLEDVCDGAGMAMVAEGLEQCGVKGARVGMDVRCEARGIVRDRVNVLIERGVREVAGDLEEQMGIARWCVEDRIAEVAVVGGDELDGEGGPPMGILQVQPMAIAVNALLGVLNELRRTVGFMTSEDFERHMLLFLELCRASVERGTKPMLAYNAARAEGYSDEEAEKAQDRAYKAAVVFLEHVVPYISETLPSKLGFEAFECGFLR